MNRSMVPVAIEARPCRMARNRSPSGTRHSRWSHGPYFGLKWVSTSYPDGSCLTVMPRIQPRIIAGFRWLSW